MPPVPEPHQGRGLWGGLGSPTAFCCVRDRETHDFYYFFKFAVEVVRAATHPLAAPEPSHCAVSKRRGFPAQRPRGRSQKWAEKEAELKINVSAS